MKIPYIKFQSAIELLPLRMNYNIRRHNVLYVRKRTISKTAFEKLTFLAYGIDE